MINVAYLLSWNPQGADCGSSNMGCYSHIALSVTCKSTWRGAAMWSSKYKYISVVSCFGVWTG